MDATTIGQQLRQAREARKLSLEQAAQATRIRVHYLQALEAGELNRLPSQAQARGFLRVYGGYLGVSEAPLSETVVESSSELEAVTPVPVVTSLPASRPTPGMNVTSEEAQAAFIEIGRCLKRQRELLGLSLDDVVRHTHLRRHYLEALEAGNLDSLPSPVQGRGMLSNYAGFLSLDPEPLMLRFAEGLQARLAARQALETEAAQQAKARPERKSRPVFHLPARLQRLFSNDLLIGLMLSGLIMGFVLWGAIRIFTLRNAQEPSPTAPSIADVLLASPSPSVTPTFWTATVTLEAPLLNDFQAEAPDVTVQPVLPAGSTGGVQVYITVNQRAYLRVTVDGEVEFDGRVLAGSAYTFAGVESVEILTGNGAALQVFYNRQDLGLLGQFGQIVNRVYTPDGVLLPTPTVTPTSTPTPQTTPTIAPTPTQPEAVPPTVPSLP